MARLRSEKLSLDIVIGGNQAQKELGDLEKEARDVKKQLEELGREIDKSKGKDKDALKEMIAQRRDLKVEIQDVRNQIKATDRTDTETLAALRARRDELIQKERALGVEINSTKAIDKATLDQMKASRAELQQKEDVIIQQQQEKRKELGLHGLTYKQLGQEAKHLSAKLSQMTYGTEEWKKLDKELQQVLDRQKQVKHGAQQTGFSLGKMANNFNKYFLMVSSFALSISGLVQGIRKAFLAYAEFDDKLADVMKTTGLTKDEVKELNAELEKIDTRTSQEDLLDLARIAGKLGINGKQDIEGFVKAADKINVALSEDLGGNTEEAIGQIGKMVDLFNLKGTFGIEESMIKVGSTINALGAASTANEAYLVEFTKRLGGIAPSVGISIQNILGLAATLDQFGQTSEVSSTVIMQLLPKMFTDIDTFAGIAKMGVNEFSEVLNKDANEAMIRVLEGLKGDNEGFERMVKVMDDMGMEGKRSIGVLTVLANNTDVLRQQQQYSNQEFAKGTSILNEFNTKNTTARAGLDKAVKVIQKTWRELGEKLAPAIRGVVSSGTMLVRSLTGVVDVFIRFGWLIKSLTVSLLSYIATVKIVNHWTVITIAVKKAWAVVTGVLSGKINLATKAMQLFNIATKANLIGMAVAAIAGLVTAFLSLRKETSKTSDAMASFTVKSAEEKKELEGLFFVLKETKDGTIERKNAIDKVNEVYGEYLPQLLTEKSTLQDVEVAQRNATTALIASMGVKAKAASDQEIFDNRIETELGLVNDLYALVVEKKGKNILPVFQQDYQREVSYIMSFGYSVERARKLADKYGISQNKVVKILDDVRGARVKERDELARNQVFFAQYISTMDNLTGKIKPVDNRSLPVLKKEEQDLKLRIKKANKELVDIEKNNSYVQTNAAKQRITNLETELNANIALQKQKKVTQNPSTSLNNTSTQEQKDAQKKAHEDKLKEIQKQAEDIKKAYDDLYEQVAYVELTDYDRSIKLLDDKLKEQQQIIEKARTTMIQGADGKIAPIITAEEATRSLQLIEVEYMEKRMEIDQKEFDRLITTTTQKVKNEEEFQKQVRQVREQYVERNSELITYEITLLEEQHRKGLVSTEQYTQRLTELNVQKNNISLQFDKQVAQEQLKHITALHSQKLLSTQEYKTQSQQLNSRIEQIQISMLSETSRKELDALNERHTSNLISESEFIDQKKKLLERSSATQTSVLTQLQTTEMAMLEERRTKQLITEEQYVQDMKVLLSSVTDTQIALLSETDKKQMNMIEDQYIKGLISETEFIDQKISILESSSTTQISIEESLYRQLQSIRRMNSEEGMAVLMTELRAHDALYTKQKTEELITEEQYQQRKTDITTNASKLTTEEVTEQLKQLDVAYENSKQRSIVLENEFQIKRQAIIDKAVQDDTEVKAEQDRLEKLTALRKQYGLQTNAELLQQELDQLLQHYKEMGMADEDYAKARAKIIEKYGKFDAPTDATKGSNAFANLNAWKAEEEKQLEDWYGNDLEKYNEYQTLKDELTRAHTQARNEIAQESALALISIYSNMFGQLAGMYEEGSQQYKLFTSFQLGLDTISATFSMYKSVIENPLTALIPAPGNHIFALSMAAITAGLGIAKIAEVNGMSVPQRFTGNYDVLGEQTGKRYQAEYQGKPQTGYVSTPSLYLAGDDPKRLKELIVSGPDLQNPMIADYARAILDIKLNRQPMLPAQYYTQQTNTTAGTSSPGMQSESRAGAGHQVSIRDGEMISLLSEIRTLLQEPTRAKVVYSDIKEAEQKMNRITKDVSRK